ncbi:conserved hypothetical protein [Ricinus communis]|uniref:Uncharacterized protein n=1 Tax=Ricinus communis TaxID=3988 RepID=B9S3W9_RICCO|nr:conserved hypothetical protein [Ricinus communis]
MKKEKKSSTTSNNKQLPPTVPHQAESCSKQNTIRPRKCKAKHRIADEVKEVADEAGKDPDGEIPNTGPGASGLIISGFGGLGLEGMVGSEDSAGEGTAAPVVGKTGSISGDKLEVGGGEVEEKGGSGKRAGAADIVEYCTCSTSDVKASDEKYAMKITNFAKNDEEEAIK